jgi:Helix-turn-helix domain
MRGRKKSFSLQLTEKQRAELQRWQRTSTLPVGLVRRARLILLLDQDQPVGAAAATAGLAPKNARKWIRRFLTHGLAGLRDQQRTGRPPVFSPRGRPAPGQDGVRATG